MTPQAESFAGWTPSLVYWREGTPIVDWCYLGKDRFTRPFFEDTIGRRMRYPFTMLFRHQTPIDLLAELNETLPVIPPTGFIFHMSRCGSTLASQMLAALPQNIVISEALPIDSILRADPAIAREQRVQWLRWMIGTFGQKRENEEYYFVKFDSWNTLWLDIVIEAFPEVPWIFMYREPVEVIASHMWQPGSQMIPGGINQLLPGMGLADIMQMPREEYCARVLAKMCESFVQHAGDPRAIAVNYNELPEAVTGRILRHFKVSYPAEDIAKMNAASRFDAKSPEVAFVSDSRGKREEAGEAAHEAAAKWVAPLYEKLEAIRYG